MEQQVRFCTTVDCVRLAYATGGEGSPIVKGANWLSPLEYDWARPVCRDFLGRLANAYAIAGMR